MTQQKNSEKLLKGIVLALDAVLTAVSLMIAFKIRYGTFLGVNENGDSVWICYIVAALSLLAGLMFDFTVHFIRRGPFAEFTEAFKRQIIVTGGLALLLYLMHRGSDLSRLVFGYFSIADLLLTFLFHQLLKAFLLKVYKKRKILQPTPSFGRSRKCGESGGKLPYPSALGQQHQGYRSLDYGCAGDCRR